MTWKISYTEIAAKQMQKLDKSISDRIDKYLNQRIATQKDPSVFGKPLLNNKMGLWRYRVDDYRIICQLKNDELIVLVLQIGHRKNVYK